jgi:predicted amidophosphoribosyltransferase
MSLESFIIKRTPPVIERMPKYSLGDGFCLSCGHEINKHYRLCWKCQNEKNGVMWNDYF